tara:strand:- start:2798 stop:3058 length:261 start_codon:yes stop_codon:yes gene_type:complete
MAHNLEHRTYIIFSTSELSVINFDQVLEDSVDTVRKSIDETKTLVKWDGESVPESVQELTTSEGIYNHDEILVIMNTTEWTNYDTI